jgi:ribosomal-protein-alanine N-acetyltransferase
MHVRYRSIAKQNPAEDSPGFSIRALTPEDAQELAYLELKIFPIPWSETSLRSFLELSNVFGEAVIMDEKIIAYMFVQYTAEEVHILNIGVLEEFRRNGLATFLLKRFFKHARKQKAVTCYLEVRVSNRGAQKLYFNYGFMPVSVRKNYYPNGEDALILLKHF